jgi:hypothetical protein
VTTVHPLMVLAAFTVAALVTYVVVLAALSATSAGRHDAEDVPTPDRRPRAHC